MAVPQCSTAKNPNSILSLVCTLLIVTDRVTSRAVTSDINLLKLIILDNIVLCYMSYRTPVNIVGPRLPSQGSIWYSLPIVVHVKMSIFYNSFLFNSAINIIK